MIYLSRPRQTTQRILPEHDVELPDELLGAAVIIATQPKTATALILKSVAPIYVGDRVSTPTE
jgi:hypothetical protein